MFEYEKESITFSLHTCLCVMVILGKCLGYEATRDYDIARGGKRKPVRREQKMQKGGSFKGEKGEVV